MSPRHVLIGFAAASLALFCSPRLTTAASNTPLVGTWRLVSYVDRPQGAAAQYPYGAHPAGLLVYDQSGQMAIQIMKTPAPKVASGDEYNVTPSEKVALLDGYVAYFGHYTVDWARHVVTTVAEGDLYATYLGKAEERPFELNGDRLTLTPRWEKNGKSVQGMRVFERVH